MTPVRVAIVEDEKSIRNLYRTKFELEGFAVLEAADGIEGLKLLKQNPVDIVLLDLRMPHMNGDEMLTKMRATEWGAIIPVIILTNVSRDEAPAQLRFLGVARYIVKAHFNPAQVVEVVKDVLRSYA
jgi:DNA-binding response OmpR family regulator